MAGVESMIVDEKNAPPKQVDREKVTATSIIYPLQYSYNRIHIPDLPAFTTSLLQHWPPSLTSGIRPRRGSLQRTADLHMAGCHSKGIDGVSAWCQSRHSSPWYVFWLCVGFSGPGRHAPYAWDRSDMHRTEGCWWLKDTQPVQVHYWGFHGH